MKTHVKIRKKNPLSGKIYQVEIFHANLGGLGGQMLDISSEDEEDNISLRNSQYLNRPPDSQSQVASCFNTNFYM